MHITSLSRRGFPPPDLNRDPDVPDPPKPTGQHYKQQQSPVEAGQTVPPDLQELRHKRRAGVRLEGDRRLPALRRHQHLHKEQRLRRAVLGVKVVPARRHTQVHTGQLVCWDGAASPQQHRIIAATALTCRQVVRPRRPWWTRWPGPCGRRSPCGRLPPSPPLWPC